jgi:hypothetical protein
MIGPVMMLWLALILSPTSFGEAGAAPTIIDGTSASSPALDPSPCWDRPSPLARHDRPTGVPRQSPPATESESESDEESGGEGLATMLACVVGLPDSGHSSPRPCTSPPGRSRRPVTCLRC